MISGSAAKIDAQTQRVAYGIEDLLVHSASRPSTLRAHYPRRRPGNRLRVALFITCFNDTLFPRTGQAVVELLERLDCEVDFPEEQTCCGQMHGNTGYADHGEALVRRWERVFGDAEVGRRRRRRRARRSCASTCRRRAGGCSS